MNQSEYTLDFLTKKTKEALNDHRGKPTEVTLESVGRMLCGVNWQIAKNPLSIDFISNIAFNSSKSFYPVLWLQLSYTKHINRENELEQASIEQ